MSKTGKVYLVGAGCGDWDLITVRAVSLLKKCDTVVYDSLIDIRLLELVPENVEKICVGKRAGGHSESQENINKLLIEKATAGKTVVRLKGGDPFVFGRGGEEILALQEKNIPYDTVPGISSAIAVPELAGIAVTHRKLSRSFHVITGHTADELSYDKLSKYAKLDGTLVFLMGLGNIRKISDGLISGGMDRKKPSAIISCGASSAQKIVRGTLESIANDGVRENVCAPAVIVIGETVGLNFSPPALGNISVAVTGTESFCEKLKGRLKEIGADISIRCKLKVNEYEDNEKIKAAVEHMGEYSWIVFTSANGVEIFLKKLEKYGGNRNLPKIAVLGKGTEQRLEENSLSASLMPDEYTSSALGKLLACTVGKNEKVLIVRGEKGSAELVKPLDEACIRYDDVKIYDVTAAEENEGGKVDEDYLIFGSSSGVRAFFEGGYFTSKKTKIISIGPSADKALKKYGVNNYLSCREHSIDGIIKAIAEDLRKIEGEEK